MRRTISAFTVAVVLALGTGAPPPALGAARNRADAPARRVELASAERVRIVDFAFRPSRLEIPKGTRVRWVNRGDVSHTTTSTTDVWDSGTLAPGETFSRVFRRRGTFRYVCLIHPSMKGKVIVT